MTIRGIMRLAAVILVTAPAFLWAAETPPSSPATAKAASSLQEVYPGLASSSLTYARLSDLPAGVVLRTGGLSIKDKDVAAEIAKTPKEMQVQLKKNAFYVLENMATRKLLAVLAGSKLSGPRELTATEERELIQTYLKEVTAKVEVSDAEVAEFYDQNKDALGGASLEQVKDQLKQYVLQEKQQQVVGEHIRTLGQRMSLEVSAAWTKEQSVLARDNPVDKARASGRPSLVDFGSTGCKPCDMLAPILETLKEKYVGKLNVLFVHVGHEQILASRYGVQTIPMQFFYDKAGKEVFRHVGFWPQAEIEKKLAEMGVK